MYLLKYPKKCPSCGEKAGAKILWGMPAMDKEIEAALDRGTLVLGGCVVSPEDPQYHCTKCEHEWGGIQMILGEVESVYGLARKIELGDLSPSRLGKPWEVLCKGLKGLCPKTWDELDPTDEQGRRYCDACEQDVYLVKTKKDLNKLKKERICVAYMAREAQIL